MALKITTANEPITVSNLCMTIYSQPGLGKTSLAFTASKPLLIDFDHGAYRAVDRGDVVQANQWDDVASISQADLAPYDTIILDTVGKALDALAADIIRKTPKLGYGGSLNQQGWGQLGVRFRDFLKLLRSFGKDVILLSHMDEKADGDVIKERLKIAGGSKDLVLTDSDVIARISINNRQRELMFSPTETSFGKDPVGLGSLLVPDASSPEFKTVMGSILSQVKEGLNELSEAQIKHREEVQWFIETLPSITDAEGMNDLLPRADKAGDSVIHLVGQRGRELGLRFDKSSHQFIPPKSSENNRSEKEAA